uniref:sensor histidine kinase n=1 Tax=uncultured Brevundimonas sp. TaxID=213418 RepID=UPI0025CD724D
AALVTTVPATLALGWMLVALASGFARTVVETRITLSDPVRHARLKLFTAFVSCAAWAAAPVIAFMYGHLLGEALAVGLLVAGYTLVFTQMRAAPKEALIVSAPYSLVTLLLIASLWGSRAFWVLAAIVPVMGLSLLIKVVVTQMRDDELAAVNARQASLIAELQAARDKADAANAAKSNFLGVISHELRTPMNGVLGAAQLLEFTELTERQKEYVGVIRSSGDGLMVLLNDILDLTKIEAGRMDLAPADVDMSDLAPRLIGPFKAQAEAKGLAFETVIAGELPERVRLDPLRLAQIAHNLLGNAIKFTPQGSVRLSLTGERLSEGRARLTLAVADSGIGIAASDIERLFQPFTQVDGSSTRRFGGTGLGLSICQRLAGLMGGEITVASQPDQGSTFSLSIEVEALAWPASELQSCAA